ncbi:MAG: hypothetical protein AAF705_07885 [Bacteroidota bacterium]
MEKEFIRNSMVNTPSLYCIDLDSIDMQICDYAISSLVNDSYYEGYCLLGSNERFNCEQINKINIDLLTSVDVSGAIEGVSFSRGSSDDYEPYEGGLADTLFDRLIIRRRVTELYTGYSTINCFIKQYTFDALVDKGDSIIIFGLENRYGTQKQLAFAKWNTMVVEEESGKLTGLKVNRLLSAEGYLKSDDIHSSKAPTLIRCTERLEFTPNTPMSLDSIDRRLMFTKRE